MAGVFRDRVFGDVRDGHIVMADRHLNSLPHGQRQLDGHRNEKRALPLRLPIPVTLGEIPHTCSQQPSPASHPAVIAHWRRSPRWRPISVKKTGSADARKFIHNYRGSGGRAVVSAEYVGQEEAT